MLCNVCNSWAHFNKNVVDAKDLTLSNCWIGNVRSLFFRLSMLQITLIDIFFLLFQFSKYFSVVFFANDVFA